MNKAIEAINAVTKSIENYNGSDLDKFKDIESRIGREIPNEIKSLLISDEDVREIIAPIFSGYELVNLESLVEMYKNPSNKENLSFLTFLNVDQNYELVSDSFEIIETLDGEAENPEVLTDMKRVLPLFEESGVNIVLLFKTDGSTELAFTSEDFTVSTFAPSVSAHLQNLKQGLDKGVFEYEYYDEEDEYEIELPEAWSERAEAV